MNFEWYTAKKLLFGSGNKHTFSGPIVKIAALAVALGMAVMLLAVMIVTGFKNEITNKVLGFGNHIKVTSFDSNQSFEESPIRINDTLENKLRSTKNFKHLQVYATKAGIAKANDNIEGIVLKGISQDYEWDFLNQHLLKGNQLYLSDSATSSEIIISKKLANLLLLDLEDKLTVFFVEDVITLVPRVRRFKISGIFETGLSEFDDVFAICDIKHIQKLNRWDHNYIGGYELILNDFKGIDNAGVNVYNNIGYTYNAETAKDIYPQIFNWLELQNINVIIILSLIILVAGINVIATMLILIFENTVNIGVLKSLGATDKSIRKIFIAIAIAILGIGLLLGNMAGLGLGFLQSELGLISLPQESYYVENVPINFNLQNILLLNVGVIIVSFLMLIAPSIVISKISPAKTLKFD